MAISRDENIIVLDDETPVFRRVVLVIVLLLIIASLAVPLSRMVEGDDPVDETSASGNRQTTDNMCRPWSVPDAFESLAAVAYPGWNWVCRLIQP